MSPDVLLERSPHLKPHHAWLIVHGIEAFNAKTRTHVASCERCEKLLRACEGRMTFGEYLRYLDKLSSYFFVAFFLGAQITVFFATGFN